MGAASFRRPTTKPGARWEPSVPQPRSGPPVPSFLRGLAAFVVSVSALFLVAALGGVFLSGWLPDPVASLLGFVLGLASAWAAGAWIWRSLGPGGDEPVRMASRVTASALTGALLLGGIGFVGGFFGPMLLAPRANQGPMLGIFVTGPGGLLLGALAGAIHGRMRARGPNRTSPRR